MVSVNLLLVLGLGRQIGFIFPLKTTHGILLTSFFTFFVKLVLPMELIWLKRAQLPYTFKYHPLVKLTSGADVVE